MRLYRVLPWVEKARVGQPGHPLYVPDRQVAGRLDNPARYSVLYIADTPEAAIAEAFGSFSIWSPALLKGPPTLPGAIIALIEYLVSDDEPILNLDEGQALVDWELRPSRVVTRDRAVTQAWALRIYQSGRFAGIRWWSYYNPEWGAFGLWDLARVAPERVVPLIEDSDVLQRARATLMRGWKG